MNFLYISENKQYSIKQITKLLKKYSIKKLAEKLGVSNGKLYHFIIKNNIPKKSLIESRKTEFIKMIDGYVRKNL